MEKLAGNLTLTELLFAFVVSVYLTITFVRRGFDDLYAFRRRRSERLVERGMPFGVVPRPALPHEGDGPGTYLVHGVLERTGALTEFRVEATGEPDAFRKSVERGVSPAKVTKLHEGGVR